LLTKVCKSNKGVFQTAQQHAGDDDDLP